MQRREFFKNILWNLAGLWSIGRLNGLLEIEKVLPKRAYGKTGIKLSIIGLGGATVMNLPQKEVNNIVSWAIDHGVNYFDVAPTYGNAEELYGIALKKYRNRIFLACKTLERNAKGAEKEFYNSLRRLKTDYIDLYQFHALTKMEDVEKIFTPKGAMEFFLKIKEKGFIRFIGFSAHSVKAALIAMNKFNFDSILFPINFVMYFKENFGPQVIKKAQEKGVSILAIKALAKQRWQKGTRKTYPRLWYEPAFSAEEASMALRFTLSQPVVSALPPADPELFKVSMKIALKYTPINSREIKKLREMARKYEPIFHLNT